ncbi:MAG: flagellar biosynthesis protein FliQ [Candidatus Omnitrophica bacterium]|nr:flagellar biosynthesis protein FliQ [Candidatus Omnitrophota bacterium]MCM8826397.1 flagellar biosynthesis protein FliQ [Candidatus Omnitrophota bacterium]
MSEELVINLGRQALVLYLQLAGPILLFSLVTGLVVSIIQAVTQIQDMTITFIPKIMATILAIVIFGPWMLRMLIDFTFKLIVSLPNFVK